MSKNTAPSITTDPIDEGRISTAPRLAIAPSYKDPKTGALYVHESLVQVQAPYAEEEHVAPMNVTESFGDVDSFVAYVKRYGLTDSTLLSWNANGLRAILDYGDSTEGFPGRCQWNARLPFHASTAWRAWMAFANNEPRSQKIAVEKLEDLAADIVDPKPADLMGLLRGLRASVNAKADTELRPDGTSTVRFESDSKVMTKVGAVELPSAFAIAIPALKGHVDANGRPVVYRLDVKVRVSVDDAAHLTLRFAVPTAERILEDVWSERVAAAKALLGDGFALLRASDI